MLDPSTLEPVLANALGRVLGRLQAGDVPDDLGAQARHYARLKAERGRAAVAAALGLQEAELSFFDAALRDVERTRERAAGDDPQSTRNAVIAGVRLLSWLETIGQRTPELALDTAGIEALVSEDVGRKQVRALELIVRSLITESYGDQEALLAHLREALNEKVVAKWQAGADAGDLLSGCTFSELAGLFVSKEEFARYEALYEDTPFLTLLKQRRKTIQSFLDDVRRIRNALAHNKRITNTQLSLLDLYYEEVVTPVQTAHDQGETKVDPAAFLDVSREDLDGWFGGLQQDVRSVRDDLGELRTDVMASLGALAEDTAAIKETTRGVNRKLVGVAIGVVVLIGLGVFLALQGGDTQQDVRTVKDTAARTETIARNTADEVETIRDTTRETAEATREVGEKVEEATEATREVGEKVDEATEATREVGEKVDEATEATREVGEKVEEATETMEAAAEAMEETTAKVVQTLEELRDGFAALTRTGGIIADARRPQELYHNARLYEQRGDYAQAMQSYRRFFAFDDLEFVDPHLRFQAFVKLQNGVAGAREVYYELKRAAPDNLAMAFAWNLLLDGDARVQGLEALLDAHPEFAPASYALSRDYSVARLGSQSLADKREEKRLLERFLRLKEEGSFLRYYLDQEVASEQVEDAKERLAALATIADEVLENPVTLSAWKSNQGWTLNFSIPDTVKEIFYRIGTAGEFKSTGFMAGVRSHAGLPLPNYSVSMGEVEKTVVQVKYSDPRGKEHGPYDLVFDPEAMLIQGAKTMLQAAKNAWLTFGQLGNGTPLLYFSHVMSNRGALREIRYGLDVDVPDRTHPFTPAGPKDPLGIHPDDQIYIEVPAATKYAVVQLVFKDGTASEVVRIDR